MRTWQRAGAISLVVAILGGLAACAPTMKVLSFLHLHRAPTTAPPPAGAAQATTAMPAADGLYEKAEQAIDARDYATALDLLQQANQNNPKDARVLNALGVIYDRLGRFDVSRRYYEQAFALDPNSPAVRANMAYSARLQAYSSRLQGPAAPGAADDSAAMPQILRGEVQLPPEAATPGPAPAATAQAAPAAAPAQAAPSPAEVAALFQAVRAHRGSFLLLGSNIKVVDASGRAGVAQDVQRHLASRGWSVEARGELATASRSLIVFRSRYRQIAVALAHTLPFSTRLQACDENCSGIRLVLGANAMGAPRG